MEVNKYLSIVFEDITNESESVLWNEWWSSKRTRQLQIPDRFSTVIAIFYTHTTEQRDFLSRV